MPETVRSILQQQCTVDGRVVGEREYAIIGLELRLQHPNGQVEELCLIPTDIRIRQGEGHWPTSLNCTVHTSHGDANFPVNAQLPA